MESVHAWSATVGLGFWLCTFKKVYLRLRLRLLGQRTVLTTGIILTL